MVRWALIIAAGATAMAATSARASAQGATCTGSGCYVDANVEAPVPQIAKLVIGDGSTIPTTSLSGITSSTFDAADTAIVSAAGPQLIVISNKPWSLTVQAGSATWVGGSGTKASTDLRVSYNGSGYVQAASASATSIVSSQPAGRLDAAIAYELVARVTDPPGTYSLTLKYTIVAP